MRLLIFIVIMFFLLMTSNAYAYIDPGSGSLILQLILGGVAGLVVIIKLYWDRFLTMFRIRKKECARGARK